MAAGAVIAAAPMRRRLDDLGPTAPLLIAALLLGHGALYGSAIVDDAGISFAYAQNLVAGHGLVAQPGADPVEGATNLLWVLLLAASMAVGWFDPMLTPKVLGLAGGAVALGALLAACRPLPRPARRAALFAAALTAINPAFALWCAAGLENGLLAALLGGSFLHAVRSASAPAPSVADGVVAGTLIALAAATRPDAALFAAAFPLLALLGSPDRARRPWRAALTAIATVASGGLLLTAYRWWWFGDLVPNTFHAKGDGTVGKAVVAAALTVTAGAATLAAESLRTLPRRATAAALAIAAFLLLPGQRLARALGGVLGTPLWCLWLGTAVGTAAGAATPIGGAAERHARRAATVYAHLAIWQFFALPRDWMPEFRFGTAFLLFAPLCLALHLPTLLGRCARAWRRVGTVCLVLLGLGVVVDSVRRSPLVCRVDLVTFAGVAADQQRVRRWLDLLDHASPSLLASDLGGRLWVGGCRIHDLAGLCDRRIARLLGRDPQGLADLVFDELRPTLIELHGYFAAVSGLAADARLRRDYLHLEPGGALGGSPPSGWFVRRDAVPSPAVLVALQSLR